MTKKQWGSLARYLNAQFAKRVEEHGHSYSLTRFAKELGLARSTLTRYMDERREDVIEGMDLDILLNMYAVFGDDLMQALREERQRMGD
jgi:predicted transcriptional regulator